ncbi:TonB family protein [Maribacter chungangensis]|uniref:TonB family protein n=1 Tax=Maribacter chungangensis TaxID=1069117 RepID=A0ABW3B160_9FLAO
MIQYILECIAFQLAFLVIYDFFLKKETFFQWNRVYLIGTYLLSLVLPWIKIEALKTTVPEQYAVYPEFLWNMDNVGVAAVGQASPGFQISWQEGILYGGMLVAAVYFAYKLVQLYRLSRNGNLERFPNFTRIVIANSEMAFSFFRSIFLGDKILEREHSSIIKHELVHIEQRHTLDLLIFEFMRIVGWFNPLVYVYQNRIAELHEFIADAQVPKKERKAHYDLLLSQIFQTQNISFVNQFYKKSLIKKRIVMLQKSKSKKVFQLKYLLILPLLVGMLVYNSCGMVSQAKENLHKSFTVSNLEQLSLKKTNQLFTQLIDLSLQSQDWSMVVKDTYSTVTFSRANKGSGISGPDGAIIQAKMQIESKILDDDFELFKDDIISLSRRIIQSDGNKKVNNTDVAIIPFAEVEKVPVFPGCENDADKRGCFFESMRNHIRKHFNYPKEAQEKGIQGQVNTMFVIDETGAVTKARFRGPDSLLKNEAKRIISRLPKMQPGEHKGEKVQVAFSIPISFKLNSNTPTKEVVPQNYNEAMDVPFSVIEEVPIFPGCEGATDKRKCFNEMMQKHIAKNFRYPKEAQEKGLQGRVNVLLTIGKDGVIKNLRMRGPDVLLENEAKRIMDLLPNMVPGKKDGKEVNVPYSIPITFKLDMDSDTTNNMTVMYNALLMERKRLLKSADAENPIIQNLDNQIQSLKRSIRASEELAQQAKIEKEAMDVPFSAIEEVPIFPGCEGATDKRKCFNEMMQKHIAKNFRYPKEAQEKGLQGRVNILLTIGKDGVIKNLRMRGPDVLLENEAKRIMDLLPNMVPGKKDGKEVNVPYSIPISFRLDYNADETANWKLDTTNKKEERIGDDTPLFMVDGNEYTKKDFIDFEKSNPNNIKFINVIKGDAAIEKYGERAKNGVVEVVTKDKTGLTKDKDENPIYFLDGVETTKKYIETINPDFIASVNVLKGKAAEDKYGEKGKNGVVEITLKKKD